ncbi:aryl-sulfate sulfotransferase [Mangrovimonas aestuarii]|uniref:aryl-sulfate sulfotransferase n=1 Tax=Mangrovimonas aestuarii TaxID=3018443 RepID=UPI0023794680|nr:aryl-sulfate sulfotransferase [Mangrovimonas aestuarii]
MAFKNYTPLLFTFLFHFYCISQNTVGTIYNSNDAYEGYTLFTLYTESYLINNCGETINQWSSTYPPGNSVYLLENGNLLRAGRTNSSDIVFGGTGGVIELYDWDGNLIWSMLYDTPTHRQHHDVYPMPNGNILVLAATVMSYDEAIQAGRSADLLNDTTLYNEQIIEVQPIGTNSYSIVWEWNIKDHLIQDIDSTKDNYGDISDNPQLLDINFLNGGALSTNWLHVNSIQYNEELDQIILSSRNLSEVYVIDHSTTTAEAASHTGGLQNKGGDFLYRWGNPQAYDSGTENDRQLYGQHYPHWIPEGLTDEGKIMIFNNGFGRQPTYSEVFVIDPPVNESGAYSHVANTSFLPIAPDFIYSNQPDLYSAIVSSAQRLPNGNTLICEGRTGELSEIDSSNNIVWEYVTPINNNTGALFSQGEDPINNLTFRAIKYGPDFPGFSNKDLTPGLPIVASENIFGCNSLNTPEIALQNINIYPNPTSNYINIESAYPIDKIEIYDLLGKNVMTEHNNTKINLESLNSGVYIISINQGNKKTIKKIIKN